MNEFSETLVEPTTVPGRSSGSPLSGAAGTGGAAGSGGAARFVGRLDPINLPAARTFPTAWARPDATDLGGVPLERKTSREGLHLPSRSTSRSTSFRFEAPPEPGTARGGARTTVASFSTFPPMSTHHANLRNTAGRMQDLGPNAVAPAMGIGAVITPREQASLPTTSTAAVDLPVDIHLPGT